jgi:Fe-S cluster biogenesis protein NfuA
MVTNTSSMPSLKDIVTPNLTGSEDTCEGCLASEMAVWALVAKDLSTEFAHPDIWLI